MQMFFPILWKDLVYHAIPCIILSLYMTQPVYDNLFKVKHSRRWGRHS